MKRELHTIHVVIVSSVCCLLSRSTHTHMVYLWVYTPRTAAEIPAGINFAVTPALQYMAPGGAENTRWNTHQRQLCLKEIIANFFVRLFRT